ncbi:putative deoxyribonuclease tatdn3 [Borealophlyctis nickersoniae]|nr:putative deoxyribonuclease tatdn3 [Borealophlyctis nickersoniae]
MLVDTHAHLYPPEFQVEEIASLLGTAKDQGQIAAIVVVPENIQEANTVLDLARTYPILQPCAGLHPIQKDDYDGTPRLRSASLADLPPILSFITTHKDTLIGVGECGLDFSPHILTTSSTPIDDQKTIQRSVFLQQAQLARDLSLPLNVHSRNAGHHAIDILRESNAPPSLLHAFDGRPAHAMRAVQMGCMLSVAPIVVRSPQLRKLVETVPLDALVLETDSPALAAEKGGRNTPLELRVACEAVAEIKGVSVDDVARMTTENARKLFPRLKLNEA